MRFSETRSAERRTIRDFRDASPRFLSHVSHVSEKSRMPDIIPRLGIDSFIEASSRQARLMKRLALPMHSSEPFVSFDSAARESSIRPGDDVDIRAITRITIAGRVRVPKLSQLYLPRLESFVTLVSLRSSIIDVDIDYRFRYTFVRVSVTHLRITDNDMVIITMRTRRKGGGVCCRVSATMVIRDALAALCASFISSDRF